jgi:glycerol-3-phosphate acyltransferase PlsY
VVPVVEEKRSEYPMTARIALYITLAYLVGSIPTAYLLSRLLRGVDIRRIGDGNVGALNTYRHISRWAGVLVALLDIAKGSAVTLLARHTGLPIRWVLVVGAVAVLGHDFMLYLGFHGGQGMATIAGVLLVVLPVPTLAGIGIALFLKYVAKQSFDMSGAIGMGTIPLLAWIAQKPLELVLYPVLLLPTVGIRKLMYIYSDRRDPSLRSG